MGERERARAQVQIGASETELVVCEGGCACEIERVCLRELGESV